MFTDDGAGDGHPTRLFMDQVARSRTMSEATISGLTEEQLRNWAGLSKRQTRALAEQVFSYLNRTANKSPMQLHHRGQDPEKVLLPKIERNLFLSTFCPDFVKSLESAYRRRMGTEALITVVALLHHRADTGYFPETLKHLVQADYLDNLPQDIYSDVPLVYRKSNGDFLLCSVGLDFSDNKSNREADIVFWPISLKIAPGNR